MANAEFSYDTVRELLKESVVDKNGGVNWETAIRQLRIAAVYHVHQVSGSRSDPDLKPLHEAAKNLDSSGQQIFFHGSNSTGSTKEDFIMCAIRCQIAKNVALQMGNILESTAAFRGERGLFNPDDPAKDLRGFIRMAENLEDVCTTCGKVGLEWAARGAVTAIQSIGKLASSLGRGGV